MSRGVSEFVDIAGASGAIYRFRLIDGPTRLPATAGNFIFLRAGPGVVEPTCCGAMSSLLSAVHAWRSAVAEHQVEKIYIRLNVSRTIRTAEHEDIVAGHASVCVFAEPG
jgi:hypothetical protein